MQKDVIENEEELPGDTIQNIDAINGNLTENIFEVYRSSCKCTDACIS